MRRPEDRRGLDPYEVLGVEPGAGPDEVTAAYREQAKRWHPDRAGAAGARRMAEINAAYELLRAGAWQQSLWPAAPPPPARGRRSGPAGSWLAEPLRRALGRELLQALEEGETVALVTPAATWASPRTLLAVTDRRLLWLLDDAPTHRVRSLRFDAVEAVEQRRRRPLRRVAVLRLRTTGGRALSFTELRPATAAAVAGLVTEGRLRLAAH
jgi:DnaJ domain